MNIRDFLIANGWKREPRQLWSHPDHPEHVTLVKAVEITNTDKVWNKHGVK